MNRSNLYVISAIVAATLSACGGGGGGGGGGFLPLANAPAPAPAPSPAPAPAPAPAVDESEQAIAKLNAERSNCGFGTLTRNSALDGAANAHAKYILLNNNTGHGESQGNPGFTGAGAFDRLVAQKYYAVEVFDEITVDFGRSDLTNFGERSVRSLLSAPYHMLGMLSPSRDIGASHVSSDTVGTTSKFGKAIAAQFDLAYTASGGPQYAAKGTVLTYPCEGTTGTFTQLSNESPNPIPSRNLATSPVGQSIYLIGDNSKTLVVSTALIQEVVSGNTVAVAATLTSANDPAKLLRSNQAIVIPDQPLKTSTAYKVTITGTNDGTAFTKAFTFTTGTVKDSASS